MIKKLLLGLVAMFGLCLFSAPAAKANYGYAGNAYGNAYGLDGAYSDGGCATCGLTPAAYNSSSYPVSTTYAVPSVCYTDVATTVDVPQTVMVPKTIYVPETTLVPQTVTTTVPTVKWNHVTETSQVVNSTVIH